MRFRLYSDTMTAPLCEENSASLKRMGYLPLKLANNSINLNSVDLTHYKIVLA